MQRRVGLSSLSVGGINIKKCIFFRWKGFPSKLGLPRPRLTHDFTSICSTNFVWKINASNLPPLFLCVMFALNEDMFIRYMKCFLYHFFICLCSVG